MMADMEEIINLNGKQLSVVKDLVDNILLSASAGTGKTNTLIYRIAEIVKTQRAQPDEILCLTFTNKACNEIKERISKLMGKTGRQVNIATFHSFCYYIIKAEAKKNTDVFVDFIVFDEDDCKDIVKQLNKQGFFTKSLQNFINLVKINRAVYDIYSNDIVKDYSSVVEQLFAKDQDKINAVCVNIHYGTDDKLKRFLRANGAGLVAEYDKQLKMMHGLDFTDLITMVYVFFKDVQIRTFWQKRYKYINIDEMQDTSELEYKIVSQLFVKNHILLCGDYFQTIYEWRGSKPNSVLACYKRDYRPKIIVFDENYRATRVLLNASYDCLNKLFGSKVQEIYQNKIKAASSDEGEQITVKRAADAVEEAAWIFAQIQNLSTAVVANIGILTRSNKYNQRLSRQFELYNKKLPDEEKIKFILVDEFKFFRRREIKDVLAFLKLLINHYDLNSLKRILKKFAVGIGERTIAAVTANEFKKYGISLSDFIDKKTYEFAGEPFELLKQAAVNENIVIFDVESTGIDISSDEIVQIAAVRLDKDGKIKNKFMRMLKPDRRVGDSYHVHGFSDEFLQQNGENPVTVLTDFIKFSADAVIVGHNVEYDLSILYSQIRRLGLKIQHFSAYYDTLEIFRRFYPGLSNYKLGFLSDYFAIKAKPTHDAFDDVMATAGLLNYAIEKNIRPTSAERKLLVSKYLDQFRWFSVQMNELIDNSYILRPYEIIAKVMSVTRLKAFYEKQPECINRIRELYLIARQMDDGHADPRDALTELLKVSALSNSDLDRILLQLPRIPIITIHQAKGTEFDDVFLAGMQEGCFPAYLALKEGRIEEEKRLFYVAVTRAKKRLYLSWSQMSDHGRENTVSRFIAAIPDKFISNN